MRSTALVLGLAILPGLAILLVDWAPSRPQAPGRLAVPRADGVAIESTGRDAPRVRLPARVWWRSDDDKESDPFVSERPGGEALPGRWRAWYFCGEDSVPSGLVLDPASPRGEAPGEHYRFHWLTTTRDGTEWWCYTGEDSRLGASSAEEARSIVGTWRHRDGDTEVRLDLFADGKGHDSDASTWEWTSAESGLELRQRAGENTWVVTACILDADRRGYRGRHDPGLVGTRVDVAPSGR